MPCRDPMDEIEEYENRIKRSKEMRENLKFLEAALCAVLTELQIRWYNYPDQISLYDSVMDTIDWDEAGITELELENWWVEHQRKDEERRQAELKAKEKKLAQVQDYIVALLKPLSEEDQKKVLDKIQKV